MKNYLKFKDEKSHKFWEIEFDQYEDLIITTYGKIGTIGKTTEKEIDCETIEEAKVYLDKQIAGKVKKGYQEKKIDPTRKLSILVKQLKELKNELEMTTVYLITTKEEKPTKTTINRIGGLPIGIDEVKWPKNKEGKPLIHAYTIDLSKFSQREYQEDSSDYRAISYFVDEESEELTTLINVFLTEEDIQKGEWDNCPYDFTESSIFEDTRTWEGHELEVPDEVVDGEFLENLDYLRDEAEDEDDAEYSVEYLDLIEKISEHLFVQNYVGGGPTWLQQDEGSGMGFFIMQFSEDFVNINLGDSGVMYVFDDDNLWQCY